MAGLDFAALEAHVAATEGVVPSAVALMKSLFDQAEALKGDPVALQALIDRGRAQVDALAAAVANPGGGTIPPPPPVEAARRRA